MLSLIQSPVSRDPRALLGPLLARTGLGRGLESDIAGAFRRCGREYEIHRLRYRGGDNVQEPFRLGIFGGVHGDEPAGALAVVEFLTEVLLRPAKLQGVDLICYPLCNPCGWEAGSRCNQAGVDLNREFWRDSAQPEVTIIEHELRRWRFDGLIALHADCDSPGLYAFARGPVTSEELVAPALRAAEAVLPRNHDPLIDGFRAQQGVIHDCYPGVLGPPPEQTPAPFEIILETPGRASLAAQVRAACRALLGIIGELPRLTQGGAHI